jgi:hypothetical protein
MKHLFTLLFISLSLTCFAQDTINAQNAKKYMDKLVVVQGKVISCKRAPDGKKINYINLDKAFPEAPFTVVLTNDYLISNNINLDNLKNKIICVLGRITTYKNDVKQTPQIFNPISIVEKKP